MAEQTIQIASTTHISPVPSAEIRTVHKVIDLVTNKRLEFINITDRLNEVVRHSAVCTGLLHVQSLHTTAGVLVSEWQDALIEDTKSFLNQLVCHDGYWRHNDPKYSDCERKNADSHIRGLLIGPSLSLQVRDSSVLLGTWQNILLAELDGPRMRSLSIQVFGI